MELAAIGRTTARSFSAQGRRQGHANERIRDFLIGRVISTYTYLVWVSASHRANAASKPGKRPKCHHHFISPPSQQAGQLTH